MVSFFNVYAAKIIKLHSTSEAFQFTL